MINPSYYLLTGDFRNFLAHHSALSSSEDEDGFFVEKASPSPEPAPTTVSVPSPVDPDRKTAA